MVTMVTLATFPYHYTINKKNESGATYVKGYQGYQGCQANKTVLNHPQPCFL